jgi:glucose-1-phosphate thymidylyltransferase
MIMPNPNEAHKLKGVVLAGGTGSRLYPLTKVTNKHLLPVGPVPMIFHPVYRLLEAGISEILIVTGTEHMGDVIGLLGSGKEMGAEFTYRVQDEAGGIAQALGLARAFAGSHRVAVILGDNLFGQSILPIAKRYLHQASGARLVLARVGDPERFGVAELSSDKENTLTRIVEKPQSPRSDLVVTGLYFYDPRVFEIISTLAPSSRGELEITDVNNQYLGRGELEHDLLEGAWTDAGTFESLNRANQLAFAWGWPPRSD